MAQRLMAILALAASSALAQGMSDPMRPPSATVEMPQGEAPAPSRLQSVLISPGRKLAVIDGQTVALGGRVGDATLVAISPTQVTLQVGAAYQTLKLHPGIEKKP